MLVIILFIREIWNLDCFLPRDIIDDGVGLLVLGYLNLLELSMREHSHAFFSNGRPLYHLFCWIINGGIVAAIAVSATLTESYGFPAVNYVLCSLLF
jgi:hypothetical protein